MIERTAKAAGWLARTGWRVTRSLPGGELAERQLLKLETTIVEEVRRRLEPAPTSPGFAWRLPDRDEDEFVTLVRPLNGHVEPLRAGMAELLNQSANSDAEQATRFLYGTLLRQLVPDEARILAALSDGDPRPVVDVVVRTALGGTRRTVLRNASSVGKHAGVSSLDLVPTYLARLHRVGLVDFADENDDLTEQYDILLTDRLVRDAEERARKARKGGVKFVRRTVTMSDLGHDFWEASDPTISGR